MISTRTNSMDYSPHSDYGFFMGWYIAVSPNVCKTHTQNARENRARKNRKKKSRPPLARLWPCRPLVFQYLVALLCSVDQDLESSCLVARSLASCCALVLNRAMTRTRSRPHDTSRTHKKQNQNHSVSRELARSGEGFCMSPVTRP